MGVFEIIIGVLAAIGATGMITGLWGMFFSKTSSSLNTNDLMISEFEGLLQLARAGKITEYVCIVNDHNNEISVGLNCNDTFTSYCGALLIKRSQE